MRYALSCRQPTEYLKKADVLIVEWRDRKGLMDLGHEYPDKTFILYLPDEEINEQELSNCNIFARNHLICRVFTNEQMKLCKEVGAKYYFGMPISSFQQLQGAKEKGASLAYITSPLTNELEKVKSFNLPVITYANWASELFPSKESNPCGNWIRPEDINIYENYIDIVCFAFNSLKQERAFYRVYAEEHKWEGEITDLIFGLNYRALNRMIPHELAEHRIKCGQTCMGNNGVCSLCIRYFDLANNELLKTMKKET